MINKKINLGKLNRLKVDRVAEPGLYLVSEDDESVLLPNQYITNNMNIGQEVDVFIYTDSEDRLVATTETPKAYLNEFAFLEVVDIAKFGLFLDWGLPKDLLLPKNKQKVLSKIGDKRVVKIVKDDQTNRLIATQKFTLNKNTIELSKNQEVNVLIYAKTDLGYKVIVDNLYDGLIFENEVFENIQIGDTKTAYIKNIRDDNKLDISLQLIGKESEEVAKQKVLQKLKESGGFIRINSKSDAKNIKEVFGLSKKAFKKVLTTLKMEDKITIDENVTKLTE